MINGNSQSVQAASRPVVQQARPYQAPPPAATPVASGRRTILALMAMVAMLVVVNVAMIVVLMQQASISSAIVTKPEIPSATPVVEAGKSVPKETTQQASPKLPAAAPKVAAKNQGPMLEAVGALSAVHLYQSFMNIGLLADGVENDTYTPQEAKPHLKKVHDLLGAVDGHLTRVSQSSLGAEDQKALQRVRTVSGQLRQQAEALQAYWGSGEEEQVARYHDARERSWTQLKDMLGLSE